jgi:hypothetical protein
MSLAGRTLQLCTSPHAAMAAARSASAVQVIGTWTALLAVWAAAAWLLLSGPVGRQALVDERVRVVEAIGGTVTDQAYAALQANPPYWIYLSSGGRALLFPAVTLAVAAGLYLWLGRRGAGWLASLSVAVHASAALVAQQLVATPVHFVRESLTSPFNLAALLPFFDEGSLPARFFGTVELFGLWWVWLLAIGCAVLAGRPARNFVLPLLGIYVGVAGVIAALVVLTGGS